MDNMFIIHDKEISIHALTRRATRGKNSKSKINNISIHALTRRATDYKNLARAYTVYFNPRSHTESDPYHSHL